MLNKHPLKQTRSTFSCKNCSALLYVRGRLNIDLILFIGGDWLKSRVQQQYRVLDILSPNELVVMSCSVSVQYNL